MKKDQVISIGHTKIGGRLCFGVCLQMEKEKKQVWKSLIEYQQLEKALSQFTFDIDSNLQQCKETNNDKILIIISEFMRECINRPDVRNSKIFTTFSDLQQPQIEQLEQWERVSVGSPTFKIIDFKWDSSHQALIILQREQTNISKITNFFKTMLSQNTKEGILKIIRLKKQWEIQYQIKLDAEPIRLIWASKNGLLFILTTIGIYVYSLNLINKAKLDLLYFIQVYDIQTACFGTRTGILYYSTTKMVFEHSVQNQVSMQLRPKKFEEIGEIGITKCQTRLYVCSHEGLRIYDISKFKEIKELVVLKQIPCFKRMEISKNYLLGMQESGFITVIELKQEGKERLTSILTNIDCPAHSPFFCFNEKAQILITSYHTSVVIINTKNIPIFGGGSAQSKIRIGLYDEQSNVIGCAEQDNMIVLYNLCIHL